MMSNLWSTFEPGNTLCKSMTPEAVQDLPMPRLKACHTSRQWNRDFPLGPKSWNNLFVNGASRSQGASSSVVCDASMAQSVDFLGAPMMTWLGMRACIYVGETNRLIQKIRIVSTWWSYTNLTFSKHFVACAGKKWKKYINTKHQWRKPLYFLLWVVQSKSL